MISLKTAKYILENSAHNPIQHHTNNSITVTYLAILDTFRRMLLPRLDAHLQFTDSRKVGRTYQLHRLRQFLRQ